MLDKTRWGRLQFCSLGTRIVTNGSLSPARRPARDNNSALELLEGYIVWAFGNQNGHSGLPRETVGEGPGAYAGNRSEFEEA